MIEEKRSVYQMPFMFGGYSNQIELYTGIDLPG